MKGDKVKFGIRFTINDYAWSEIWNFIECSEGIVGEPAEGEVDDLRERYVQFCHDLIDRKVKPSTLVDDDVITCFSEDLHNRVQIDLLEGQWDDEPNIVAGGRYFQGRWRKLRDAHPDLVFDYEGEEYRRICGR